YRENVRGISLPDSFDSYMTVMQCLWRLSYNDQSWLNRRDREREICCRGDVRETRCSRDPGGCDFARTHAAWPGGVRRGRPPLRARNSECRRIRQPPAACGGSLRSTGICLCIPCRRTE